MPTPCPLVSLRQFRLELLGECALGPEVAAHGAACCWGGVTSKMRQVHCSHVGTSHSLLLQQSAKAWCT